MTKVVIIEDNEELELIDVDGTTIIQDDNCVLRDVVKQAKENKGWTDDIVEYLVQIFADEFGIKLNPAQRNVMRNKLSKMKPVIRMV